MNENKNRSLCWQKKASKSICKTKVVTVQEEICVSPDGTEGTYFVMNAADWVVTVPVVRRNGKNFFLIVEQWRHGTQSVSREFPGGVINQNEEPEIAAARELLEETGYQAGSLQHLGTISPNPAIMTNRVHFYAASQLTDTHEQHLDSDEFVHFLLVPEDEIYDKMGKEPYTHALMCAAYDMYRRFGNKER